MNKISEIISMPVISLYESEHLGIVYNVMFDYKQKKIKYICIMNETNNIPKIIKFSDIFKIGKDCIFIKNKTYVELQISNELATNNCANPINLPIYNFQGEYLGNSQDVLILDNNEIKSIVLNNGKNIPANEILNISSTAIIVDSSRISLSKFKPKIIIQKTQKNPKVMILATENIEEKPKQEIQQNTKIITDSRFLLGRIINKDIVATNGEIIAKKTSTVTKEIINKASFYGKLVEISRYSDKKSL